MGSSRSDAVGWKSCLEDRSGFLESGLKSMSYWAPSWVIRDCRGNAGELVIWCSEEVAIWEEVSERENHQRSLAGAAASASHDMHSTNSSSKLSRSRPSTIWNNMRQTCFSTYNRSCD